jgi:hypothetical protein
MNFLKCKNSKLILNITKKKKFTAKMQRLHHNQNAGLFDFSPTLFQATWQRTIGSWATLLSEKTKLWEPT